MVVEWLNHRTDVSSLVGWDEWLTKSNGPTVGGGEGTIILFRLSSGVEMVDD